MNTTNTKGFEEEKRFKFNSLEVYVKATYERKNEMQKVPIVNEHDEIIKEENRNVGIDKIIKAEIEYQGKNNNGKITFDSKKSDEAYIRTEDLINSFRKEEETLLKKIEFYQNLIESNNQINKRYQGLSDWIRHEFKKIKYYFFFEQDKSIIGDLNKYRNQWSAYQELQEIVKEIEEQETDKTKKEKMQELLSAIDRNEKRCEELYKLVLTARMEDMLGLRKV